jgi:hypothetical protein
MLAILRRITHAHQIPNSRFHSYETSARYRRAIRTQISPQCGFRECPDFLYRTVVEFALPFARQQFFNGDPAMNKLGTITPSTAFACKRGDPFGIA